MMTRLRAAWKWIDRPEGEHGSVLIFVAILMAAMLGFTGLVIDYGRGASEHRQTQNVADSAAQSAAYEIYAGQSETSATAVAHQLVQAHGYNTSDLTSLQYLDASSVPTTIASNVVYVQSVVTKTIPTTLMGVLGVRTETVTAGATLKVGAGNGPCALCLMSTTQGINVAGTSTFNVTGGNIWLNDQNSGAINGAGSITMSATKIGIVAPGPNAVNTAGHSSFNPQPTTGAPPVPDPLASVQPPIASQLANVSCPWPPQDPTTCNITPGSSGTGIIRGLNYAGNYIFNFAPGVYVFTGDINVAGNFELKGSHVMLYFTCGSYSSTNTQPCNGSPGAGINGAGTITYQITAPTSGQYAGLAIYYDRTNNAPINLAGSAGDSLTGTIYAKDSTCNAAGTFGVNQLNSRVIVGNMNMAGTPTINLTFNKDQNYKVNQLPVFTQ